MELTDFIAILSLVLTTFGLGFAVGRATKK